MELKITLGVGSNPEKKYVISIFCVSLFYISKLFDSFYFFTISKSTFTHQRNKQLIIHQTKCSKKPYI